MASPRADGAALVNISTQRRAAASPSHGNIPRYERFTLLQARHSIFIPPVKLCFEALQPCPAPH